MEFYHLSNISPPESHSPIDMNMDTTIDTAIVYLTDKAKQLMNLVELEYFYAAGILVDEALDYYMTLTNKTILLSKDDRSYRDTVISFKACFKLCRIYLKIKDRVIKQKDLIDVLDQIEEARSSPLTSKIFCMVLKRLSQLFLDNDLLVAANSCIQLILDDKMLANNHFSAGVKDLEAQLEYMIRVFLNSIIKLWGDSSASPNEVQMGDELFRDLLYELGVEDHNKMPTIVENPQEALDLYGKVIDRLSEYRTIKKEDTTLSLSEKALMTINNSMWFALVHHYMYFFEQDDEKEIFLLLASSEMFDYLSEYFFSKNRLKNYFPMDYKIEYEVFCNNYRIMLDKNSANYRALLYHFKTVALKLTPEDAKPAIVQLNKLHKNFMRICSASLFSWYLNKYSAEWQKGTVIIDLVTACRSMIVEDAAEKKNYLDTSILYLEKLAQITSSDAFMENVTCEGLALINLTAEEHAVRVDQDEFIQKFRKN